MDLSMKHMCATPPTHALCCSMLTRVCAARCAPHIRHRRASRSYLPKEMQDKQTPFAFYVQAELGQVQAERAERAALGTGQPYNRQLP
jgi:hypothetical protein